MSEAALPKRWSFDSRLEAVPEVRRRVEQYLIARGCEKRVADEFVLAIDELCNNAVQHGPAASTDRLVLLVQVDARAIRCRLTAPSDLTATELKKMTDVAALPDFESERGRGLFLIRMMVDGFTIREKAAGLVEMEMEKHL